MHGFGISVLIRQMSKEALQVSKARFIRALSFGEQGWISSEWGTSENNRKAKFYKLTPAGRKQLSKRPPIGNAFRRYQSDIENQ